MSPIKNNLRWDLAIKVAQMAWWEMDFKNREPGI